MMQTMKNVMITILGGFLLAGCATTPPFNCDNAREKIIEQIEYTNEAANDFHAADAQKDGKYYGVKAARTATCLGSLGILCGFADSVASDNTDIEKSAQDAESRYKKSSTLVKGFRKAMQKHNCDNIPEEYTQEEPTQEEHAQE